MDIILIIILVLLLIFTIGFNVYLVVFNDKITKLENIIISLFENRTNLVPSLFDITKDYVNKHNEVFSEILKLRKLEINSYNEDFLTKINLEIKIHNELNFIFTLLNKQPKLNKNEKFLLVRDLFLEQSSVIGKKMELYKSIIKTFNKILRFKNLTIIGLFIDIDKKIEI